MMMARRLLFLVVRQSTSPTGLPCQPPMRYLLLWCGCPSSIRPFTCYVMLHMLMCPSVRHSVIFTLSLPCTHHACRWLGAFASEGSEGLP